MSGGPRRRSSILAISASAYFTIINAKRKAANYTVKKRTWAAERAKSSIGFNGPALNNS